VYRVHLGGLYSVCRGFEDSASASERLSSSLKTGDNIAGADSLVGGQVGKEQLEICGEASDLRWSDEREDCSVAVWSLVETPFGASNGRGRDGGSAR